MILLVAALGGVAAFLALLSSQYFVTILFAGFIMGGTSNPLYSLLIAYTNDYLEPDDMAAASGGLVFISGIGAIAGPLIIGWMMDQFGAQAFFMVISILMIGLAIYAGFRMTQTSREGIEDGAYTPVMPSSSLIAVEVASEFDIETALLDETKDA